MIATLRAGVVAAIAAIAVAAPCAWGGEPRLSPKIAAADPAVYAPRMANEWPNPRVLVDTDGVYLFEDGSTHPEHTIQVEKLGRELTRLSVSRWPWGRIIALSVSPRMPVWKDGESRDDDPRFATLVRVRQILKRLDLVIVESPVGCHCQ